MFKLGLSIFLLVLVEVVIVSSDINPYLRLGVKHLDAEPPLTVTIVNKNEKLYCDAFKVALNTTTVDFDNLTWSFVANGSIIYSNPTVTSNTTHQIYSLLFVPFDEEMTYNSSQDGPLQCCTVFNATNVKCLVTYVVVDPNYYINGVDHVLPFFVRLKIWMIMSLSLMNLRF